MATTVLALVMAGLCGPAAEAGKKPDTVEKRQYEIRCLVTKGVAGEKKLLAEPRLVTLEGRPAVFLVGGETPVRFEAGDIEKVRNGFSMSATVRAVRDGKLRLDVTIEEIKPPELKGESVRVGSKRVRTIATVKPEEAVKVTMGPYTCKIKVQPQN